MVKVITAANPLPWSFFCRYVTCSSVYLELGNYVSLNLYLLVESPYVLVYYTILFDCIHN